MQNSDEKKEVKHKLNENEESSNCASLDNTTRETLTEKQHILGVGFIYLFFYLLILEIIFLN